MWKPDGSEDASAIGSTAGHTLGTKMCVGRRNSAENWLDVPQHNFTQNWRAGNQNSTSARNVRTPCTAHKLSQKVQHLVEWQHRGASSSGQSF